MLDYLYAVELYAVPLWAHPIRVKDPAGVVDLQ